jgi:hypothetical protein
MHQIPQLGWCDLNCTEGTFLPGINNMYCTECTTLKEELS